MMRIEQIYCHPPNSGLTAEGGSQLSGWSSITRHGDMMGEAVAVTRLSPCTISGEQCRLQQLLLQHTSLS